MKGGITAGRGTSAGIPSQRRLAAKLGLSVATVSLALNHHPRVSARTRLRVSETAARLGYVANHAARRLARARFHRNERPFDHVGFLYLGASEIALDAACLRMMSGAEHGTFQMGATMTFVRVADESHWEKVERLVRAGGVDGWFLVGHITDETVRRMKSRLRPCVILGDHRCTVGVHGVDIDHRAAGRMAAEHLAALGHRRIGFLGASMRFRYQRDAFAGFRTALLELCLDRDRRLVQTSEHELDLETDAMVARLLAVTRKPTAMFSAEPGSTLTVLRTLRQMEVDVPREVSVVGCELQGNAPMASSSVVELGYGKVGYEGARLLRRIVAHPAETPRIIRILPSLVEGWSCAPPCRDTAGISTAGRMNQGRQ